MTAASFRVLGLFTSFYIEEVKTQRSFPQPTELTSSSPGSVALEGQERAKERGQASTREREVGG